MKHYREHGLAERKQKTGGQQHQQRWIRFEDAERVVQFIKLFALVHAVDLPGRIPGFRRSDIRLLPSSVTKVKVWEAYKNATERQGCRSVSLSSFQDLWRQLVPHIAVARPMTDLCSLCQVNNTAIIRAANLPDADKSAKLKAQQVHLDQVAKERELYRQMVADCSRTLKQADITQLSVSAPMSRSIRAHYSFDFAQQVFYPNSPQQPGKLYFLVPRKAGIFGICCEGLPQQVNYIVDEAVVVNKGSNAVISYLDHFFSTYGIGEEHVDLHCDNCAGQNKNNFVLWYFCWRVLRGLHKSMSLHFMIAGHTKFAPDWCFGLLKQRYRRCDVSCLDDLADVVRESTNKGVNIPQLVGREDGQVLVPHRDWQTYLSRYFSRMDNVKSFHHFTFSADKPGVVQARGPSDIAPKEVMLLRHEVPTVGLPEKVDPPGLSEVRKQYLAKHIREFCREEVKDLVCPVPTSVAGPSSQTLEQPSGSRASRGRGRGRGKRVAQSPLTMPRAKH